MLFDHTPYYCLRSAHNPIPLEEVRVVSNGVLVPPHITRTAELYSALYHSTLHSPSHKLVLILYPVLPYID